MGFRKQQETDPPPGEKRKYKRDFEGLTEQIKDPDPAVRRWAIKDLAGYPEAVAELVSLVQHEPVASNREVIFTSLVKIGNDAAVKALISFLSSKNASLRNEAIDALKDIPDGVEPFIENLLHDPDSDIRIFAITILESLNHSKIEDWLLDVITNDPHINVCTTAVDLLSQTGSKRAIPYLDTLISRFPEEDFVRFSVDVAKKMIQEG